MPLENLSWIVPAGAQAWDNRKHIVTIWDRIVAALRGKKSRIAFTGVSGTGKTVLFDCLTGDGFKPHYSPPKFGSAQEEQGSLAAKRSGLV